MCKRKRKNESCYSTPPHPINYDPGELSEANLTEKIAAAAKVLTLDNYSGGQPCKGWIAQMEEHWYANSEVSGSSPGSVKFSLPIFQIVRKILVSSSLVCLNFILPGLPVQHRIAGHTTVISVNKHQQVSTQPVSINLVSDSQTVN